MTFFTRIGLASFTLALLTGLLILRGPQVQNIVLIAQGPSGSDVAAGATISMTFSRPVDPQSAEQNIVIDPPVAGSFVWQRNAVAFQPDQPLAANTTYRITVNPNIRDTQGKPNRDPISWEFRTRSLQLLVVRTNPEGTSTLTRLAPDGNNPQVLLTIPERILHIALAPDSSKALLSVQRSATRTALVLIDLADGSSRPLADDPEISANAPAWSNNQDFIAYVQHSLLGNLVGQPRIWLAQPDGTSYGPLFNSENLVFAPVWSPDGSQLAYVDGATGEIRIYQMFSDSHQIVGTGNGEPADWAPDGSALVYTAQLTDQPQAPMLIRRWDPVQAQSSDLTDGQTSDHSPTWSPQGQQIAFVRIADDPAARGIWVMASDGSGQRQLTNNAYDTRPVWSPDNTQLAVIRLGSANTPSSLWVIDVASGTAQQVIENALQVHWLP
jgi:hypothetical protein